MPPNLGRYFDSVGNEGPRGTQRRELWGILLAEHCPEMPCDSLQSQPAAVASQSTERQNDI